jgi:hypothetical protein
MKWPSSRRLDKLIDCLGGIALEYVNKLDIRRDYFRLCREMKRRFSTKDAPVAARRQVQFCRQSEDETLEQFSQRVHFLVIDGYPTAERKTIQQISVEAFLRGCREKDAARAAMEKEPRTIHQALKYVKSSAANQRAIFGSRSYSSYGQRQVTFSPEEEDSEFKTRVVAPTSPRPGAGQGDSKLDQIATMLHGLTDIVKESLKPSGRGQGRFSRSPTPPRSRSPSYMENITCFKCKRKGHLERNCPDNSAKVDPRATGIRSPSPVQPGQSSLKE